MSKTELTEYMIRYIQWLTNSRNVLAGNPITTLGMYTNAVIGLLEYIEQQEYDSKKSSGEDEE